MASSSRSNANMVVFEDLFPSMVARMGTEGFMEELRKGFRLLMDEKKGVITFESLKSSSSQLLGLDFYEKSKGTFGIQNDDDDGDGDAMIREMLKEGDLDGDGCLTQMEFYVLMFRLSPALMNGSRQWFQDSFFS